MPVLLEPEAAKTESLPKVEEIERLRLHNLFLQQLVCREQLNVLTMQFLQTAQPKALQERMENLGKSISALGEQLFADANLDAGRYQLNVEEGTFVERPRVL